MANGNGWKSYVPGALATVAAGVIIAAMVATPSFLDRRSVMRAQVDRHEIIVGTLGTPQDPLFPTVQQQAKYFGGQIKAVKKQLRGLETQVEERAAEQDKKLEALRTQSQKATGQILQAIGQLQGAQGMTGEAIR